MAVQQYNKEMSWLSMDAQHEATGVRQCIYKFIAQFIMCLF